MPKLSQETTEQHGLLSARIDGIRDQPETTKDAPPMEPAG